MDLKAENAMLDHLAGRAHPYEVRVMPITAALKNDRVRDGIVRLLLMAHGNCAGRVDEAVGPHLCLTCAQPWAPDRWPCGGFVAERADLKAKDAAFAGLCADCLEDDDLEHKLLDACRDVLGEGKVTIAEIRRSEL